MLNNLEKFQIAGLKKLKNSGKRSQHFEKHNKQHFSALFGYFQANFKKPQCRNDFYVKILDECIPYETTCDGRIDCGSEGDENFCSSQIRSLCNSGIFQKRFF